jgi:predicted small lipoprotein YifL
MEFEITTRGAGRRSLFSVLSVLTLALALSVSLAACGKKAPPEPLDSALHPDLIFESELEPERAKL